MTLNLVRNYAKKLSGEIKKYKIEKRGFANGEFMAGPYQSWDVQLSFLSELVRNQHPHRDFSYETVKNIISLEHPKVFTRGYISSEEYERTLEKLINATIKGIYLGKLGGVIERKTHKKMENSNIFGVLFKGYKGLREEVFKEPIIQKRIEFFSKFG